MKAYLISIGDELLIGQTINTNVSFIGSLLSDNQITVIKSSVIGDEEEVILEEFAEAMKKADLVIVTGGLGPTHDDITRKVITSFFKSELILNEEVLQDIRLRFERIKRTMVKVNEEQALVPKIATPIRNYRGTAPGFWIEQDEKIFVAMPGVPHEMKEMMSGFVIPKLRELYPVISPVTKKTTLLTTGIPESTLFERLGNIEDLLEGAKLAFLPSPYGVKMRITVTEATDEEAGAKLSSIEQKIRAIAGRFIYGKNEEDLAEIVGRMLKDRGYRIAIAESCTGGNISSRITDFAGSSEYFDRGVVSYSNAAKVEILKVDEDTLIKYGAVSYEVARQMAAGIRAISGADIGLAITGILGPGGGTDQKPVGTVFIGYCDDKICISRRIQLGDDRAVNKQRASQAALAYLRNAILGISLDE